MRGIISDLFKEWPCQSRINKILLHSTERWLSRVQLNTVSVFLTILQEDENIGSLKVMDNSGSFLAIDPQAWHVPHQSRRHGCGKYPIWSYLKSHSD
ncbi:hypothetical protein MLD38_006588 [Melastoma candidum]|uniref:Uncharacterized protein n=1 Tax=Melastoma candidum TaxID=119954 RepID=A0ACB9RWU4_9MYRT|nr:hypothetical protein MLD38_006588 [Melastoma candidum]